MNKIGDWLIAVIYLAALYVMVRPKSQGPSLITSAGTAVQGIVSAATGGGTWSS